MTLGATVRHRSVRAGHDGLRTLAAAEIPTEAARGAHVVSAALASAEGSSSNNAFPTTLKEPRNAGCTGAGRLHRFGQAAINHHHPHRGAIPAPGCPPPALARAPRMSRSRSLQPHAETHSSSTRRRK